MQTYGDWQLQLQLSSPFSVAMLEAFLLMLQLLSHRVTSPPRILKVGLCISILPQFIPNMFLKLSIILIMVISYSTKTTHGYVVTVEPHNPRKPSDHEWYLPHHPVVNPKKPIKLRLVLNGASKFHGTSLNKSILVGLDLLQNIISVLLRFYQHKYAVSADIEGMFIEVGVLARDQISLHFLWREDTTSDVVVHQYTRHIFGARAPISQLIKFPHTLRPHQL